MLAAAPFRDARSRPDGIRHHEGNPQRKHALAAERIPSRRHAHVAQRLRFIPPESVPRARFTLIADT